MNANDEVCCSQFRKQNLPYVALKQLKTHRRLNWKLWNQTKLHTHFVTDQKQCVHNNNKFMTFKHNQLRVQKLGLDKQCQDTTKYLRLQPQPLCLGTANNTWRAAWGRASGKVREMIEISPVYVGTQPFPGQPRDPRPQHASDQKLNTEVWKDLSSSRPQQQGQSLQPEAMQTLQATVITVQEGGRAAWMDGGSGYQECTLRLLSPVWWLHQILPATQQVN